VPVAAELTLEDRLAHLVLSTGWMARALEAGRDVAPPDWFIGAGAVRGLVWDHLHGAAAHVPQDIDLVFFDAGALDEQREAQVLGELVRRAPELPWDVKNQAAVHLWYPRVFGLTVEPLVSSADAVATWPETATAVAIRMLQGDRIEIVAPFGLGDLFGLACRRNPRRVTLEEYRRRVRDKRFALRWPLVTVLDEAQSRTEPSARDEKAL
jgi:hypothetical protein